MAPSQKEIRLRQLILDEHMAGSSIDQATKNLHKKVGHDSIKETKVKYWFRQFDKGKTSLVKEVTTTIKKPNVVRSPKKVATKVSPSTVVKKRYDPLKELHAIYRYYLGDDF